MSHWMPRSPCGDHCLPSAAPSVGAVRRAGRLLAVLAVVLVVPVVVLLGRDRLIGAWFRTVLRVAGARLRVLGPATFPDGALVVADHVSWLDVVALNAVRPCRTVAKAELRSWPFVGALAAAGGTIFIDRARLHDLPGVVARMTSALRDGECVAVFPEGTTSCGRWAARYRRAPFQAAVDAGAPVQPVAIRFLIDGARTTTPAFVGTATLLGSLYRVTALRGLVVEVGVLAPLAGGDRRALAAAAESVVRRRSAAGSELSCTALDVAQWSA